MSALHIHRPAADQAITWGIVLLAWVLAIVATLAGYRRFVDHHVLIEGSAWPWLPTLLVFLAAWQVMTAGMMLPSSLPMIKVFGRASQRQAQPRLAFAAFMAGYFAVWTGFALLAFAADTGLHWSTDHWRWLSERGWLIAGTTLIVAGAFQFSNLKEKCLTECRSPTSFFWRYYQRGLGPAWKLGVRHGIFCLGCCWALMLIMFGLGVGSVAWMAALTGVMLIEKTTRRGQQLVPAIGAVLLAWGGLVLLQPGWLPPALSGA